MVINATIVMPTHNRRQSLRRTLEALCHQSYPSDQFEVVVIADGCTDGTATMLQGFAARAPFSLRWLEQTQAGPAAARNAAIGRANAEVMVFLDDDVVPVPTWLAAHLRHHEEDDRVVVIGPLSPGSKDRPAWVRWEDDRLQQQYHAMLAGLYAATPRQFYTGNSSMRRHWIEAAGGFDGRLRRGEDVELAFRCQKLGLRFVFEPCADGQHHAYRTFQSWLSIPDQYGHNDVQMVREQERGDLLQSIAGEFRARNNVTQGAGRLCLGRPPLFAFVTTLLRLAVTVSDRRGMYPISAAACSGLWNLLYWRGLSEELGGASAFWALVDATRGRSNARRGRDQAAH